MLELNDKMDSERDDTGGESVVRLGRRNSREENLAEIKEATKRGATTRKMRESVLRLTAEMDGGPIDILDEKAFPVHNKRFSWKKAFEKLSSVREAEDGSGQAQLLRAGIQTIVNRSYESVPTTFEDWVHVVQSSKREELYAPLQGISFPGEVPESGIYQESKALGLDIKLKNRKYGQVFPVTMELEEDDQTGQMANQVSLIGEYLKQVLEVLCYGKLASVANMQYAGLRIRTSETKPASEANYPWTGSAAPMVGGGYNKPASAGALSQANIQNGIIALADQRNLLGLKMGVAPSRLLASFQYRFDAAVLLHSGYYPSGAAAAGSTGGALAINPIQGILDATYSRFMFDQNGVPSATSKAWYIVDDSKPFFIAQIREAAATVQEVQNSGESFNRDLVRVKGRTRCNADFIDPRFAWQGSDGSA